MLDRAGRGDVEGHFRRAWLLSTQLENFFILMGFEWSLGSKAELQALQVDAASALIDAVLDRAQDPKRHWLRSEALVLR